MHQLGRFFLLIVRRRALSLFLAFLFWFPQVALLGWRELSFIGSAAPIVFLARGRSGVFRCPVFSFVFLFLLQPLVLRVGEASQCGASSRFPFGLHCQRVPCHRVSGPPLSFSEIPLLFPQAFFFYLWAVAFRLRRTQRASVAHDFFFFFCPFFGL